jgi:CHASE3 domain sensor protein
MQLARPPMTDADVAARRRAARRTALVVGGIAIAIYVAFLASGVIGR